MTNADMKIAFEVLMDEYTSDYFQSHEFDRIATKSLWEWQNTTFKNVENTTKRWDDLAKYIMPQTFTGTDVIRIADLNYKYMHIVSMKAKFNVTCNGVTTVREVGVKPLSHDKEEQYLTDPFNVPTNSFPAYKLENIGGVSATSNIAFKILSTTIPSSIEIVYMRYANAIDTEFNGGDIVDADDYQINNNILGITVKNALNINENQQLYQNNISAEIPINSIK